MAAMVKDLLILHRREQGLYLFHLVIKFQFKRIVKSKTRRNKFNELIKKFSSKSTLLFI